MLARFPLMLLALIGLVTTTTAQPAGPLWEQVREAVSKGLPRTAIESLEAIIERAEAEGAQPEALRAIAMRIALETKVEGGKPEEAIFRLEAALEGASSEMTPILETLLARWYWSYFQENRWRFQQRTLTAAEPGPDFRTWDLARILAEIDRRFSAALASEDVLRAIPIQAYDDLLMVGSASDRYRPTLYDFIAHEALAFYQAGEQGAIAGEEDFILLAESAVFDEVETFLDWRLPDGRPSDPILQALRLYQKLLRFHRSEGNEIASLDADLARFAFGSNFAVGEEAHTRYRSALERFVADCANPEIAARARAALAEELYESKDYVAAREVASEGYESAPETAGGARCFNLLQRIDHPSLDILTESAWSEPLPSLEVSYRNLTQVYFRAIAIDYEEQLARSRWEFDLPQTDEVLTMPPDLEWSSALPPTDDFQERTERLPAPGGLAPGYYLIVASSDAAFSWEANQLSLAGVWVGDLALVVRTHAAGTAGEGRVMRADSGEPIAGAEIRIWSDGDGGRFFYRSSARSGPDGSFQVPDELEDDEVVLVAEHEGHRIANTEAIWIRSRDAEVDAEYRTVFFTDRALYRPGQSIRYKGICSRSDRASGDYSTVAGEEIVVVFKDPNGKEISRAIHRTNDFGSFSGVFTAPRDRVTGRARLIAEGRAYGSCDLSVEEYKRPKFEVALEPTEQAAKLGEEVSLSGKATTYTGAPVGGGRVTWRVERRAQLPHWYWWWPNIAVQAIAHGTTRAEEDGSFAIRFAATPDQAVPPENDPVFVYSVYADVTDSSGETRSAQIDLPAGYAALRLTIDAPNWLVSSEAVTVKLVTEALDQTPQSRPGTVSIYELQQPKAAGRSSLGRDGRTWARRKTDGEYDRNEPDTWPLGQLVATSSFQTDESGRTEFAATLPPGAYRAVAESSDRFGQPVAARATLLVLDPKTERFPIRLANHFAAPSWEAEPGQTFRALWGTGYGAGRAWVEVERDGERLFGYWTKEGATQQLIEFPVTERMRGGVVLRVTYLRENRAYVNQSIVRVPWTNKQLNVSWERFRSKLKPGDEESWTAVVAGADAEAAVAELVAGLYDASLDQFLGHAWPSGFPTLRQESLEVSIDFSNTLQSFLIRDVSWPWDSKSVSWSYRSFPPELAPFQRRYLFRGGFSGGGSEEVFELSPFEVMSADDAGYQATSTLAGNRLRSELRDTAASVSPSGTLTVDLDAVAVRRNLGETAFFFPHLTSDEAGVARLSFTMPQSLTRWRFLGFAHDPSMRAGLLADEVVTAKELMVQPNPPRFLREGDQVEFVVKVLNQSDAQQTGRVRLSFADAATLDPVDQELGLEAPDQSFKIPAKQSRSFSWRIAIPEGMGYLVYKTVAASEGFSDGEEGYLPVLSRRILVTESLPLPMRGQGSKSYRFDKLVESGDSDTLRSQALTLQMVSQPAWYAVLALPYLMEFPHQCSEQIFNRYYANELARHIAASDPKIRRIFDLWKGSDALGSPLAQNEDLKSILLEETPWLRNADRESQARRNVGLLFDANQLNEERTRALRTLADRQDADGLWSWFPGGASSSYISLYIAAGFGRLRHLGVESDVALALKALDGLDAAMVERYRNIVLLDTYVPSPYDAFYLYGRSFFLEDQPIPDWAREAVDFFLRQSRTFWLQTRNRQTQAHLALALQRFGDRATPAAIVKSLKERSVSDEELGMFWRDTERSWWWYRAPIETQAMMIEAFAEIAEDAQAVEDCKVWLLKQKQTRDWKTTKATADAIYALLLRGEGLLASDALVEASLGGRPIRPQNVEAGTGFYERTFVRGEIDSSLGEIELRKIDDGVSWGSAHWEYLEDIDKVTPHEATPLKLRKQIFVRRNASQGQRLETPDGPLQVGDEIVVRIEIRSDRDMEYLHLKDQRGSGTEPVSVMSRYRYQDGLAYYQSTRDTAIHFFIDYLPKGVYVFEYALRVQLKGVYESGVAEIQCMYAPEFNSHSESVALRVE